MKIQSCTTSIKFFPHRQEKIPLRFFTCLTKVTRPSVIASSQRAYSVLFSQLHAQRFASIKQFRRGRRSRHRRKKVSQDFLSCETSFLRPDSRRQYPLANFMTRFALKDNSSKVIFPKKLFFPEEDKEVRWFSPPVGETPEFIPEWALPFQTNPFEPLLASRSKALKKIQQSRESLPVFTQQTLLEELSKEMPLVEPAPNIFYHFFTRNDFIHNFLSKKKVHVGVNIYQSLDIKMHSHLQKIFIQKFQAKQFFFRREHFKLFLQKACQSKKKFKYYRFQFINSLHSFYRLCGLNNFFSSKKKHREASRRKGEQHILAQPKRIGSNLTFFNGSVQKMIFFKKKINFFIVKNRKWRRRELFYFQKKWEWNAKQKVWQLFDKNPLFFFPSLTVINIKKLPTAKQSFFSLYKFSKRWIKKKSISNLFWNDCAVFTRVNWSKILFGQSRISPPKKIIAQNSNVFFYINTSSYAAQKFYLFNPFFNEAKPREILDHIKKKIQGKLFFEISFDNYTKKIFSAFVSIDFKKINFFPSYTMAQLYYFLQRMKSQRIFFKNFKKNQNRFTQQKNFSSLREQLCEHRFNKANFFVFFDQKKKIFEKKRQIKRKFFSKVIPSLLYLTHSRESFEKKEKIFQKKLKKYCAVVSERTARKRQEFIERSLRVQANIQEETERKTPDIIESKKIQEATEQINNYFDEVLHLFQKLRWNKINSFSKVANAAQEYTQNFKNSTASVLKTSQRGERFSNFGIYHSLNFLFFSSSIFGHSTFFTRWKKKAFVIALGGSATLRSEFARFKGQWSFSARATVECSNINILRQEFTEKQVPFGVERDYLF